MTSPEPTPDLRTWAIPAEPGPEVTAVRDVHGRIWRRSGDWCYVTDDLVHTHWFWSRLITVCGPLVDATERADRD